MKIGIVGNGVVGQATARAMIEHVDEVCCWDIDEKRRTHNYYQVLSCDIVFVCLPTPQRKDGMGLDVSVVDGFFADAVNRDRHDWNTGTQANYVLRSTVPIDTTLGLYHTYSLPNLVHNPEFLTARCATLDAQLPARHIIGVPHHSANRALEKLAQLYQFRWPHVPIHYMDSSESEALKLIQNSFFATKVAFFNEVYELCNFSGLDWKVIREALLADGRIHPSHTLVPGPDGKLGFGGNCLPKDLSQFIAELLSIPNFPPGAEGVAIAAYRRNQLYRKDV